MADLPNKPGPKPKQFVKSCITNTPTLQIRSQKTLEAGKDLVRSMELHPAGVIVRYDDRRVLVPWVNTVTMILADDE